MLKVLESVSSVSTSADFPVLSLSPLGSLALAGIVGDPPHAMPCLWLSLHPHQPLSTVVPFHFCG